MYKIKLTFARNSVTTSNSAIIITNVISEEKKKYNHSLLNSNTWPKHIKITIFNYFLKHLQFYIVYLIYKFYNN